MDKITLPKFSAPVDTVRFTPAQAEKCLEEYRDPLWQRGISDMHVARLARRMQSGDWARSALDFVKFEGRLILINGQHRLSAQSKTNVDLEWTIHIHHAKSRDAVDRFWTKFDTLQRSRTPTDWLGQSMISRLSGASNMSVEMRAAALRACLHMGVLTSGNRRVGKADPQDAPEIWEEWKNEIASVMETLHHEDADPMFRRDVRAARRLGLLIYTSQWKAPREHWLNAAVGERGTWGGLLARQIRNRRGTGGLKTTEDTLLANMLLSLRYHEENRPIKGQVVIRASIARGPVVWRGLSIEPNRNPRSQRKGT